MYCEVCRAIGFEILGFCHQQIKSKGNETWKTSNSAYGKPEQYLEHFFHFTFPYLRILCSTLKEPAMQKIDNVGRVKAHEEDHMVHSPFHRTRNIFIDKWQKPYRTQTRKNGIRMFCCQSYSARSFRHPVCLNTKNLIFFFSGPTYYFNSQVWRFQWVLMTLNEGFHYVWSIQC